VSALAEVWLWGTRIGAVALADGDVFASFQYDPDFLGSGIQVEPLMMPLAVQPYRFLGLATRSFHGLPGLLADSLPDKYGKALIDAWLAAQNRTPESFNAVERLSYTGARGMGALEFRPATGPAPAASEPLDVAALVDLASRVLSQREGLQVSFAEGAEGAALGEILQVGTSAGGARAKAVIAWNPTTHQIRSGQVQAGEGFEYWLIKFDGVSNNSDKDLADPQGYGAVEYAYAQLAAKAGIEMSTTRLLEEGGRRHFMTKRFDRLDGGGKLHMQSLAALAHFDFKEPTLYGYEQAFLVMNQLDLPRAQMEQQFLRMLFNVVARNQDDHVKNIAFLMGRSGEWRLAPAYDVTWAYNASGAWTNQHQMSVNGKRDGFTIEDFRECAGVAGINPRRVPGLLDQVRAAVQAWPEVAASTQVTPSWIGDIGRTHRLDIPKA
jgi:serine/threonine-protein kinase HipA